MNVDQRRTINHRRGGTLIEVSVSLVILTALFAVVGQSLLAMSHQRRALERRRLAGLEAANLMEQIIARPWNDVSTETLSSLTLPADVVSRLPEAELQITVRPMDTLPEAKKVNLQITWLNNARQVDDPVRLVAWIYQPEERP